MSYLEWIDMAFTVVFVALGAALAWTIGDLGRQYRDRQRRRELQRWQGPRGVR